MAPFKSYQHFFGSYSGELGGRRATLEIGDVKNDSPYPQFHITLTDLDRNEVYAVTHTERGHTDTPWLTLTYDNEAVPIRSI
ncbi:MAG: hypothetical protein ACXV3D_04755 [Halobacteriota archaeon]